MKTKRRAKPKTETEGDVTIKIYPHRRRVKGKKERYVCWQVADKTTGKRRFQTFRSLDQARRVAKKIAMRIASGQATAAQMTNAQAASFGRASELIRPTGDSLEIAAARYAEAVKILGGDGARLITACREFMQREGLPKNTVAEVATEM